MCKRINYKVLVTCLLLFLIIDTNAQSSPCDCPDGFVFMPPNNSTDPCDPQNLISFCVPMQEEVPVDEYVAYLIVMAILLSIYYQKSFLFYKKEV